LGRLLVTHFGANASCGLTIDLGPVALDVGTTASQGFLRAIKVLAAAHQRLAGPLQLFVGAALDRGNLPVHAARPSIESTFLLVHTRFAFVEAPLPLVGNLFAAISGLLPVVSQTVALVGDRVATISSFTPLPRTPTPARPRALLGAASTCPGRSIPSTVAPACAQVDGQSEECLAMSTRLGPGATGQPGPCPVPGRHRGRLRQTAPVLVVLRQLPPRHYSVPLSMPQGTHAQVVEVGASDLSMRSHPGASDRLIRTVETCPRRLL
jgi:hypothetical protein